MLFHYLKNFLLEWQIIKMNRYQEWQFDGLPGPTHNYAGLAVGNIASAANAGDISNPKQAAFQGLEKARFVRGLKLKQSILPPHYRPMIPVLKQLGFGGGIAHILETAHRQAPHLLAAVFSSSFMWAANAGTVTPSCDATDGRLHITPANLLTNLHRSIEGNFTTRLLRNIFNNCEYFAVHDPLPSTACLADEGAANHMRISGPGHAGHGLHVFVYGAGEGVENAPRRFPARQGKAAYEAIARRHRLDPGCTLFVQQSPRAIDAGVFHNDVIAMNTTRLMIAHEAAFAGGAADTVRITDAATDAGIDFQCVTIREAELPLADAVKSYFFNAQLLELEDGRMAIVAPSECGGNARARAVLEQLSGGNGPIAQLHYRDVRDSMRNGGGPACLRLRVVMNAREAAAIHPGVVLTDPQYAALTAWVGRYYRDRLCFDDLRDPAFIIELNEAYSALEVLLGMPGLYSGAMA